jgi:hypothetical protein
MFLGLSLKSNGKMPSSGYYRQDRDRGQVTNQGGKKMKRLSGGIDIGKK